MLHNPAEIFFPTNSASKQGEQSIETPESTGISTSVTWLKGASIFKHMIDTHLSGLGQIKSILSRKTDQMTSEAPASL